MYKSHWAVCSFIEVVQNTYGTASPSGDAELPREKGRRGRKGTVTAGWAGAGRHRAARGRGEALGCWYQAPGREGGKQEAGSASGCQRLPSCAAWARWARPCHPKGTRGWQSWCQPCWSRSKQPLPARCHGSPQVPPPLPATSPVPPSMRAQRCCSPGPSPGARERVAPARQHGQTGRRGWGGRKCLNEMAQQVQEQRKHKKK